MSKVCTEFVQIGKLRSQKKMTKEEVMFLIRFICLIIQIVCIVIGYLCHSDCNIQKELC